MPTTKKHKITIAFDLYGTILSTDSITAALSAHFGRAHAAAIATSWRRYQLEYTWRLIAMGAYEPFDRLTRAALRHAAAEVTGSGDVPPAVADQLMRSYDSLAVFPDVVPALEALQGRRRGDRGGVRDGDGGGEVEVEGDVDVEAVIFSNGTEKMLRTSVDTSPDLKPFRNDPGSGPLFRRLITVDDVRTYKPSPQSYSHLQAEVGGHGEDEDEEGGALVWLVSANPFDVAGARSAGLRAAWIDRAGTGWVDRLGEVIYGKGDNDPRGRGPRPTVIAKGVDEAVNEILKMGI